MQGQLLIKVCQGRQGLPLQQAVGTQLNQQIGHLAVVDQLTDC